MKLLKLKNKLEKKNFKKRELKKEYLNKKQNKMIKI